MPAGTMSLSSEAARHAVLFYRTREELAGQVSAYLLEALRDDGTAIVIATPSHREAFARALAQAGVDVEAAEAAGAYVALDALETMGRFMVGDWPSPASFWQALSPLVRDATGRGKLVRAYGEMVALLWDFGQVNAAIEVEAMWNELGAQYPFSLLCAYPADSVQAAEHQDALAEVCRVHSAVAGDPPGRPGHA